ncbi:MAG: hypothetical protein ACI8VC_002124 [Candidatus Endobugula sp.]|jgi:hypothetical protein
MRIAVIAIAAMVLSACGGGGGSSTSATTTAAATVNSCSSSGGITISGTISYERVPFSATTGGGLDYANIQTLPARGVVVQALGASDCVINSTFTDNSGAYSLNVTANADVKIRARAQTVNTVGATWDFEVLDNTESNALYVLDGQSVDSGSDNSVRNLTAASGWTGSSYGAARSAAPFAILDSIYDAIQKVVAVDATVVLDDADVFWSVNNSTANGSIANGEIGTSFYSGDEMYILGTANSDTDEFDGHVIIHEWGHYFEDNLSRSESIGGQHSIGDKLDFRLALGEGFGNAFSGMVTDDPAYRDSSGASQGSDFEVNVETNATVNTGWFSEGSVQTILYDIYDATGDADDSVSLGFAPIYNAMTSAAYKTQSSVTSIFSLVNKIKVDNPGSSAAIDALVVSQSISAIADEYGFGEANDGGDGNNLPVYKVLANDGIAVPVCSTKANGEPNKLGARQFMRLNVASGGVYNIVATRVSGLASSDPDIRVYLNGNLVLIGVSGTVNTETINGNLNEDEYTVEVREFTNTNSNEAASNSAAGDVCFNVTVS